MFPFTTDIKAERAAGSAGGESAQPVEALLIGSAVIIHDGLSKVVTVSQRLSGNVGASRVDGIESYIGGLIASQLGGKLVGQPAIQTRSLASVIIDDFVTSVFEQANALGARPRTKPLEPAVDHAQSYQTVKRRID